MDQVRAIQSSFRSPYDRYELAAISLFLESEELLKDEVFPRYERFIAVMSKWRNQWRALFGKF